MDVPRLYTTQVVAVELDGRREDDPTKFRQVLSSLEEEYDNCIFLYLQGGGIISIHENGNEMTVRILPF